MTTAANASCESQMMLNLSETALVVLSQAAQRDDRIVLPLPKSVRLSGGARDKFFGKLLRNGFIEQVRGANLEQSWRTDEDGSRLALRISAQGLQALGIELDAMLPGAPSEAGIAGQDSAPEQVDDRDQARADLLAAPRGEAAVADRDADRQYRFRPGSKQALLVDQLSHAGGRTLDELGALLGWQRHTVRAAITGLRHKGFQVVKSKPGDGRTVYQVHLK